MAALAGGLHCLVGVKAGGGAYTHRFDIGPLQHFLQAVTRGATVLLGKGLRAFGIHISHRHQFCRRRGFNSAAVELTDYPTTQDSESDLS